jgi:HK97 family phage portal protein
MTSASIVLHKARQRKAARTGDSTLARGSAQASPTGRALAVPRTGIIEKRDAAGLVSVVNYPMPSALALDYSTRGLLRVARISELVNACLRIRSDGIIAPQLVVERRGRDGLYVAENDHPLLQLLRSPGETIDAATLWRCMSVSWDATGLVYLEPIYGTSGTLEGLEPLDPSLVREVRNQTTGELLGYDWGVAGYGQHVVFGPDELIVRRTVFWADPPPLATALAAVDADASMTSYVRAFFANAGVPSGVLKVKGQVGQEQADDLQARWTAKYGRDGLMLGGPAVLDDNADYQRVGANLDELESDGLRGTSETRVCMPFGVSPILVGAKVGLDSSTYSNFGTALKEFWDGTMSPLLKEWASWLGRSLLINYESVDEVRAGLVRCRFDTAGIGPYADDSAALLEQAADQFARGAITRNEYRAAAGKEPTADGDVYYIPSNVLVEQATKSATRPTSTPRAAPALPDATMPRLVPAPAVQRERKATKPPKRVERDVGVYLRDQYAKARRLWIAGNDKGAEAVLREIERELDDGIALFGILAPHERSAYADAYKDASSDLDSQVVLDSGDLDATVEQLAQRVVGIADTTKREIADVIVAGAREQLSDVEIARQLDALGFERAQERSPLIVRTELANAAVLGAVSAYDASGVVSEVEWLVGDDACPDCQERAGSRYALADVTAGSAPELPAHPACRCDWAPIIASEVQA